MIDTGNVIKIANHPAYDTLIVLGINHCIHISVTHKRSRYRHVIIDIDRDWDVITNLIEYE